MFRSTSRFPHFDSQLLTASIKGGKGVSEKKLQQQHRRTLPAIMATFDEQQSFVLNRSSRATRGKRMTKLLDDELEDDEQFWNQDALKEEEDDTNYEEEKEAVDVFDSDFDEDEPEPDEEVENDADVRVRTKKRLMFPGKTAPKRKTKRKVLSKLESASKDEEETSHKQQTSPSEQVDDLEGERIMRKSTRTSVIVRQAERDAIRAALQATMKPIVKRKKEGEEKRMTQEEMLLEAAQTEIMNLKNLERVLAREEEVKKRAVLHKAVYSGPQIRYSSRNGQSFLEFSKGVSFESEIYTTTPPYPQQAVCAVTGLPAKYRDPKTGLAYATKDSFRIIRERFLEENSKERKKMEMGILFDAVSSLGFLPKRKRSQNLNRDVTSYQRYWARFRSIPALEYPSLD